MYNTKTTNNTVSDLPRQTDYEQIKDTIILNNISVTIL